MARTPLMNYLRKIIGIATYAKHRNISIDQVLVERKEQFDRKKEMKSDGVVKEENGQKQVNDHNLPHIAIVGGGLAGLTCAYRLKQQGYLATVYEASDRLGGRCFTRRGFFKENQMVERGGEFINSDHKEIRKLVKDLGLTLQDVYEGDLVGTQPFYYIDGQPYTYVQATKDFLKVYNRLKKDVEEAGYPTLYNQYTPRGLELDQMSIIDYINQTFPGGIHSRFGQLVDIAYNTEYGDECVLQSSLNLLYLLGYASKGPLEILGPSDERYHVLGGNDLIVSRLVEELPSQIKLGKQLIAIKEKIDGRITLTFQTAGGVEEVVADKVVLALPFRILRESVDYSQAGFRKLKRTAIAEQGMGANTKLQLQFDSRYWQCLGNDGETISDTGYQITWDVTRWQQPSKRGILCNFTGGNIARSFGKGTPALWGTNFLKQIEVVLPGITSQWNGKVTLDYWPGNPWSKGSYSYYQVGQYTKFAGIEKKKRR